MAIFQRAVAALLVFLVSADGKSSFRAFQKARLTFLSFGT